jgi:hypothetical protein
MQNALSITSYAIRFRIPGTQEDRQLLRYYCVQGAPQLTGYLSSEFWDYIVLQCNHENTAVRQATVALSCAHRSYTAAGALATDAIVHYNKVMWSFRKYLNAAFDSSQGVSLAIPLICSVLFLCFENTQGKTENALQYINNGLKVLGRY